VSTAAAEEAIEDVLGRGGDADDALRDVVALLQDRAGYTWAGIFFVEAGALVLGPSAGDEAPGTRTQLPVLYDGARVAELAVDGAPSEDGPFLERVASRIAAHCLVGWDTYGSEWTP
jgi:hypothetical protein